MKNILLILTLLTSLAFGSTYTSTQAKFHVGDNATICGVVVSAYYARSSKGEPTFINLDRAYPNQEFTIVVWGDDRYAFDNPETRFTGKNICVTGYIDSYNGVAQITAEEPSQIR